MMEYSANELEVISDGQYGRRISDYRERRAARILEYSDKIILILFIIDNATATSALR